jgi:hypothetical protein
MPFADKERQREYQREYKRQRREQAKTASPFMGVKIFFCQRYPSLHISGVGGFLDGFLIIENDGEAVEKVVEHPFFGESIFPLALDLTLMGQKKF